MVVFVMLDLRQLVRWPVFAATMHSGGRQCLAAKCQQQQHNKQWSVASKNHEIALVENQGIILRLDRPLHKPRPCLAILKL
jgi:hypothetical protein